MSLALALERYPAQVQNERETIVRRLENWGACYRVRKKLPGASKIGSLEGNWRSPQEWEYVPLVARPGLDVNDAEVINNAWMALPDSFHQALLGAWYVQRWSAFESLKAARRAAGMRAWRRGVDIDPCLAMAHVLLRDQLGIPAVVRRARLVARTRQALNIPAWGIDNVAADPL